MYEASGKLDRNKRERCEMGSLGTRLSSRDIEIHGKIAKRRRGGGEIYDTARIFKRLPRARARQ